MLPLIRSSPEISSTDPSAYSTSAVQVDLDCLAANVAALRSALGTVTQLGAVVKADGYGLGSTDLTRHLQALGIKQFFVFDPLQATHVRPFLEADASIVILRPLASSSFTSELLCGLMKDSRVQWTVHCPDEAKRLEQMLPDGTDTLAVHLEVDTGMNRGGCSIADLGEAVELLRNSPRLRLVGVSSHLATADESLEVANQQLDAFQRALTQVELPVQSHILNSHGILSLGDCGHHVARAGLSMFGYFIGHPGVTTASVDALRPAIQWSSEICQIRTVAAGEWVGYGRIYQAERTLTVGIVPVGYADGYPARPMPGHRFEVGIKDREGSWRFAPVIGHVNMDQLTVDLTDIPGTACGTPVQLYGDLPGTPNFPVEVAQRAGTIVYDLFCRLGRRVDRRWA